MNQRGFTVFEILVTIAMILGIMTASTMVFRQVALGQNEVNLQSNFLVVRSNIVSLLRSSGSWEQTFRGATNAPIYNCIIKQDSTVAADRTCATTPLTMDIYDTKGNLYYDAHSTSAGFSADGNICDTYAETAAGGTPDPMCPIHLDLQERSLCTGITPCENPAIEIVGTFKYSSPKAMTLNLGLLGFRVVKSGFYCPDQALPMTLAAQGAGVSVTGSQVAATVSGKVAITGSAHFSQNILSCRSVQVRFSYTLGASDLDADSVIDTESVAQVCLVDTASVCQFAIQFKPGPAPNYPTFDLLYKGAVVATKPAALTLTSSSVLGFNIYNGRVDVCMDGACFFAFDQKLSGPFNIEYRPASASYSSGFTNVTAPVIGAL